MSYPTWTAEELRSSIVYLQGICWRVVEFQYESSTFKLVDDDDEHSLLESMLETVKPPIPEQVKNLKYLLYTPFRYEPAKNGSRFRRKGQRDGAFYASENLETALAELSFLRLLTFIEDSPDTPIPTNSYRCTAFQIDYKSDSAIDLTEPPLNSDRKFWEDPVDYTYCQNLADEARKAHVDTIRSTSVRCPNHNKNITILNAEGFASNEIVANSQQTWWLDIKKDRVTATRKYPNTNISFTYEDFSNDPRLRNVS